MARGELVHLRQSSAQKTVALATYRSVPSLKDKAIFHPGTAAVKKTSVNSQPQFRSKPRGFLKDKAIFHPGTAAVKKTTANSKPQIRSKPRGFLKDKAVLRYGLVRGGAEK